MNRYQNNAFRILGLPSNASVNEVLARANEIKVKSSVGIDVKFDYDFPWIGPIDRSEENLNNAVQRIENPLSRFKEELAWFWIESENDKEAVAMLIKGDHTGANNLWKADLPTAWHNRLILIHSFVIALESSIMYEDLGKCIVCSGCGHQYLDTDKFVFCLKCGGKVIIVPKGVKKQSESHWKNWDFVIDRMNVLQNTKEYWSTIREKARLINDPRLGQNNIDEICNTYLRNKLNINFQIVKRALEEKDYERVKPHISLINKTNLPGEDLREGLNVILKSRIDFINEKSKKYEKYVSDLTKTKPNELVLLSNQLISEVSESIHDCDLVDIKSLSEASLAKDNLAKTIKTIAVKLNRDFDDNEHALYLINKAIGISSSEFIKQDLEENKKVAVGNIKFEENLKYEEKFGSDVISINKEFIKCGNKSLETKNINAIRCGVLINSTNGIVTSRLYTFWVTDGQTTIQIECSKGVFVSKEEIEKRFNDVNQKLYTLVQYPLINAMIDDFKKGKEITIGNLTITKKGFHKNVNYDPISRAGINLISNVFGSENAEAKEAKERFLPWEDWSGWNSNQGMVNIGRKVNGKGQLWTSLTLREVWNAINIDPFLEYLNKDSRLWLIIKEPNNGNS